MRSSKAASPASRISRVEIVPYQERKTPYTDFEIATLNSGDQSLFFTGRFCYRDVFSAVHFTDFCLFWNVKKNGFTTAGAEYCHIGNNYGDQ